MPKLCVHRSYYCIYIVPIFMFLRLWDDLIQELCLYIQYHDGWIVSCLFLYVCIPVCLSACVCIVCLSVCMSVYLHVCLFICLSVWLNIYRFFFVHVDEDKGMLLDSFLPLESMYVLSFWCTCHILLSTKTYSWHLR